MGPARQRAAPVLICPPPCPFRPLHPSPDQDQPAGCASPSERSVRRRAAAEMDSVSTRRSCGRDVKSNSLLRTYRAVFVRPRSWERMVPYLCRRCRRLLPPIYFIWHLRNTQFRRARTKDHERSPGVVPTLKVVVWGADQKGQRRARCSDALPLVLARTDQEIALAAECLGSCPPAAPNPPSSYLPQTRHPVRVLIT